MEISEVIWASGHANIQALHPTTLMVTKDKHLSKNGDCVIAIAADKALTDLCESFKELLKRPTSQLIIQIDVDDLIEKIYANGSPKLILNHSTDLVVRKSAFICNRTLGVQANKASTDLSRQIVQRLKNPNQEVKITLTAKTV